MELSRRLVITYPSVQGDPQSGGRWSRSGLNSSATDENYLDFLEAVNSFQERAPQNFFLERVIAC